MMTALPVLPATISRMEARTIFSVSVGVAGRQRNIHVPAAIDAVYNTRYDTRRFCDGQAATLEERAAGPVHSRLGTASDWNEVITKPEADPDDPGRFQRTPPGRGTTPETITDAIAAFAGMLITPNGLCDRYLRGDRIALDARELAGHRLFDDQGGASCHQGGNLGGNLFQRLGSALIHAMAKARRCRPQPENRRGGQSEA